MIPSVHYVQVVDTVGSVVEKRTDIAAASTFIRSASPASRRYFSVAYAGAQAAPPSIDRNQAISGSPGSVSSRATTLDAGRVRASVDLRRSTVVVLSAWFDPGWKVRVDGHVEPTQMIEPALVGVRVPAGRHVVQFYFVGFQYYWLLFLLGILTLAALVVSGKVRRTRTGRHAPHDAPPQLFARRD